MEVYLLYMREYEVERYKRDFENNPASFWSFGADLVDAGSPNPCSRSAAARKVLGGRWQEAFQMWLDDGEYSRDLEELYVGFILASEVIVNKRPSAAVPKLPKRIWNDAEYAKAVRRYEDLDFRDKMISLLLQPSTTTWGKERIAIGTLIKENKPEEAERLFYEKEWDFNDMAENNLALIRSCSTAEPEYANVRAMWFYFVPEPGNKPEGPMSFNKLKGLFQDRTLPGNCKVWRKGFQKWQPVSSVKSFAPFIYSGEAPPPVSESD